jgi:transposase
MTKRERRTFTDEFKHQIVQLYLSGKPRKDIIREYDLTPSSLDKWINCSQATGSFKEKDNLTEEQAELIKLRKHSIHFHLILHSIPLIIFNIFQYVGREAD